MNGAQEVTDYAEALMKVAEELGKDVAGPLLYLDVRVLVEENQRLRDDNRRLRDLVCDELTAEAQRLGLYGN